MRLACVLVAGCFQTSHRPTCELDPEPVADDVEVGGTTGAALLARVEGTRSEAGTWDDGAPAEVTIDVGRTGSAEHVHTTRGEVVSRDFGFGSNHLTIYVPCGDFVRVPVALHVTTADQALDVAADTFVDGPMTDEAPPIDEEWVRVSGDVALDEATVPDGSDGVPADYDDTYAFAEAAFPPDDGPTEGHAGWGGSQETEETSSTSAFYVLEW